MRLQGMQLINILYQLRRHLFGCSRLLVSPTSGFVRATEPGDGCHRFPLRRYGSMVFTPGKGKSAAAVRISSLRRLKLDQRRRSGWEVELIPKAAMHRVAKSLYS